MPANKNILPIALLSVTILVAVIGSLWLVNVKNKTENLTSTTIPSTTDTEKKPTRQLQAVYNPKFDLAAKQVDDKVQLWISSREDFEMTAFTLQATINSNDSDKNLVSTTTELEINKELTGNKWTFPIMQITNDNGVLVKLAGVFISTEPYLMTSEPLLIASVPLSTFSESQELTITIDSLNSKLLDKTAKEFHFFEANTPLKVEK